jgi:DNA helicase HerA-like ATPase
MSDSLLIATNGIVECRMLPHMLNRHGLIAGATGTGKTVTLQSITERLSEIGVPVMLADVKGDLAGLSQPGGGNPKVAARVTQLGLPDFRHTSYPVAFWDVFGELGHPVRASISDMGPMLLGRLLGLNETQAGVLTLVFRYADDAGLLLLDLKDLRAALQYVGENRKAFTTEYGQVSAASVGAIQRGLLTLEEAGGGSLFGEPSLALDDLFLTDASGRGIVNILAASKLMMQPAVYSTFLLWLLAELFEQLPEVGDVAKPKLVFFFDEAHLLFKDAPAALVDKVEQVVRLIRSKGIGIFFVTQNPLDLPETVLGQLGNRVQHALRAYTPRDQKAVRAAAETFRPNPALQVETAIAELETGEALVSFLDEKGAPGIVERVYVVPARSKIGPIDAAQRTAIVRGARTYGKYERAIDRESAYELLRARAEQIAAEEAAATEAEEARRRAERFERAAEKSAQQAASPRGGGGGGKDLGDIVVQSAARGIGYGLGRSIVRGMLGSFGKGR